MSFSLNPRKLYLQTFWKMKIFLDINRGIQKRKKIRLRLTVFEKIEFKVDNIVFFSKNTSQEKGKAMRHGPITWADGNATLFPFEKPYSVYTDRRSALISVDEEQELLKSTSSEESFPLERVKACARRVQFSSVLALNFWAVLSRYKYLRVSKTQREKVAGRYLKCT